MKYLTTRTKNIATREKNKLYQNKQVTLNTYSENNQTKHVDANKKKKKKKKKRLQINLRAENSYNNIINDSYKALFSNLS